MGKKNFFLLLLCNESAFSFIVSNAMCLLDDHKNLSKRASMCFIMVCQCNDSDFVHAFHTKGKMVKLSWALVPLLSCSPLKYERDTLVCIHRRPIEIGNLSNMRMALSFSFILVSLFARRCFFFFFAFSLWNIIWWGCWCESTLSRRLLFPTMWHR